MIHVSSAEVQKQFGRFREAALTEPVIVQQHGRDSVAIISAAEYERLRKLDRTAKAIGELSDAEAALLGQTEMRPEHAHLNALLQD